MVKSRTPVNVMLIRSTWTLTLSEPATIPRAYGLELVKDLHRRMNLPMGEEKIPTVTYSGILGSYFGSKEFLTFSAGNFYQLSLCGLQERAAKAISNLDISPCLELFGAKFNIVNRDDETSSYETLYQSLVAIEPEPNTRLKLKFLTPTTFAQQRTNLPLPIPLLMFRSWLERWNCFAPVYLGGDELLAYLSDAIALKSHKIQTHIFNFPHGYVNGFTGNVTLQILRNTKPLLANVANLLVAYAQFSGTGMKTRLGMGQTEIIVVK
jgi:CRISPR-associated endoribonuclease Cas6